MTVMKEECPKCHGIGYWFPPTGADFGRAFLSDSLKKERCPKCKGTGKVFDIKCDDDY